MEKTEVVIDHKFQGNLNLLIENTLVEDQKMEEVLDFCLCNNASQPKKNMWWAKTNCATRPGESQETIWQIFLTAE